MYTYNVSNVVLFADAISCNRELQHAVASLQKNIQSLKGDVARYKTRAHKAEEKLNKVRSGEKIASV